MTKFCPYRTLNIVPKKHQNRLICDKSVKFGLHVEFCMLFLVQEEHRLRSYRMVLF